MPAEMPIVPVQFLSILSVYYWKTSWLRLRLNGCFRNLYFPKTLLKVTRLLDSLSRAIDQNLEHNFCPWKFVADFLLVGYSVVGLLVLLWSFGSRQTLSFPLDLWLYTMCNTQSVGSLFRWLWASPSHYAWHIYSEGVLLGLHIWVNCDGTFSLETARIDWQKVLLIVDGWSCWRSNSTVEGHQLKLSWSWLSNDYWAFSSNYEEFSKAVIATVSAWDCYNATKQATNNPQWTPSTS